MSNPPFEFLDPGILRDDELELVVEARTPGDPPRGWVPAYRFGMRVGEKRVGAIDLRIGSTPNLELYAGHIGYTVIPEFRGHHYAERSCRLILPLAARHGMTTIWITCNPDNTPSRRTCERLGASLVEIVPLPPDNDMYLIGEREKCRYKVEIHDNVIVIPKEPFARSG